MSPRFIGPSVLQDDDILRERARVHLAGLRVDKASVPAAMAIRVLKVFLLSVLPSRMPSEDAGDGRCADCSAPCC